jgi:hypothetical protein
MRHHGPVTAGEASQVHGEGDTDAAQELIFELRCQVSRDAPYSMLIRSKLPDRLLQSLR